MKALIPTLALAMGLLTSCVIVINNDSDDRQVRRGKKAQTTQTYRTIAEQVPLSNLQSITASLNMAVEYVQKDTIPTAYITGQLASDLAVEHSGAKRGHFKIGLQGSNHNISNHDVQVKVRIVAPTLHKVTLYTNATFTAPTITTSHFTAETATNATLHIGHLHCEDKAHLTASTNAMLKVTTAQAPRIALTASTNATATLTNIEAQHLTATASTNASITLSGHATKAKISENTNAHIRQNQLRIGQ